MHCTIDSEFSRCLNTLYKSENRYATRNEDYVCAILQEPHYKLRIDGPDSKLWDRCFLGKGRIRKAPSDEDFACIFKDALPYLKAKL